MYFKDLVEDSSIVGDVIAVENLTFLLIIAYKMLDPLILTDFSALLLNKMYIESWFCSFIAE